ncbi:dual specificity mitogen-activated protein kinase kinase 7-like isoform X1 [Diabrotica virgifera virgifera]|uniref:mitogen-activated protein kinase kinase n=1 Tax=Diabrotica virgifera virgifera TaxID=50390 RepID=A0ABM5KI17_DIAVI|nr:dual specificity mitogen-activated protein kinase kinase 7-like isoform X1 [Diabrotica virgifera virgifera]
MSEATSKKIDDLLSRIQSERSSPNLSFNRSGNGSLPPSRKGLSLGLNSNNGSPVLARPKNLIFTTRQNDDVETEKKLKEIMKISGDLTVDGVMYKTDIKDMEHIEELGNGTCGHVVKMRHKPSGSIIAVKQMRRSGNSDENKRIIMDIEVVLKSHDCKYIVQCLGCFITDSEVWICMELMDTCFDKLLRRFKQPIPEEVLGKVTVATVAALSYLKDKHDVMHRDVKPSNILLDTKGNVKLCDFGISGRLVDSMAKTRSAGCAAYMAPERIEPPDPQNPDYDIRADVWSLGITLVEMATGVFPYQDCKTDFEVLTKVIGQDPPTLPADKGFSEEFRSFVRYCLVKDPKDRPKYNLLKSHEFIKKYERVNNVNVGEWYVHLIKTSEEMANRAASRQNSTASSIRQFFTSRQSAHNQQPPSSTSSQILTNGKTLSPNPMSPKPEKKVSHISRFSCFQRDNQSQEYQVPRSYSPYQPHQSHVASLKEQLENRIVQNSTASSFASPSVSRRPLEVSSPAPNSPYEHRRVASETRWRSPSASPLPLRSQFQVEEPLYHSGNTSPIILQRFYHQQKQLQLQKEAEESGKKRFSSFLKLQLGGDRSGRSSRHQSPEPPPRLSRRPSGENQSPLALRRNFLENNSCNSPSLSRRYVSPTPPLPPPRRLSESTSVPGSPQHLRTRFHYTPEPQRRLFQKDEVS